MLNIKTAIYNSYGFNKPLQSRNSSEIGGQLVFWVLCFAFVILDIAQDLASLAMTQTLNFWLLANKPP